MRNTLIVVVAGVVITAATAGGTYKVRNMLDEAFRDGYYEGAQDGIEEGYRVGNAEAISCVYHERPNLYLEALEAACTSSSVKNPYSLKPLMAPKRN